MSKLLVLSIRSLPNPWSRVPMYSYQPRKGMKVSKETSDFFEQNDVHLIDISLNQSFYHYPLSNKPLVCAHHEKKSKADYLLFVDSDSLFLKPPELLMKNDFDIHIRPVDLTNNQVPTDIDFRSGDAEYWKNVYQLLDIKRIKSIQSTIDKRRILEYFNSGFVCVKRQKYIFSQWLENFEKIMDEGIRLKNGIFFVEQTALSATIAQMDLTVDTLNSTYNFPVSYFSKKWRRRYPYSLKNKVHIHYHKLLKQPELIKSLSKRVSKLEGMSQLAIELKNVVVN